MRSLNTAISRDDLPYIFERFYTGKSGNTGIGLALAKEIIEIHKGGISAQNGEAGAAFTIHLPIEGKR